MREDRHELLGFEFEVLGRFWNLKGRVERWEWHVQIQRAEESDVTLHRFREFHKMGAWVFWGWIGGRKEFARNVLE
jgi:hypothetical protein